VVDAGKLGSEEVPLSSWEGRATVNLGIQVSGHCSLDKFGASNVLRLHVRELDPVLVEVMGDPEHRSVYSLAPSLLFRVRWDFFFL